MKYIAASLEEVAKAFDRQSATASKWAEASRTVTDKKRAEIEAHTWAQAAQMLRDVELRP